ncbi:MFS transporter [Alkaliphilus transvaalensis]|uniref:MFS transporter n=1 Tax=Alkaliphilus transvaalensis TaxID=114628 RepID=UPI00047BEABD|nr:MFS transporter [Alkaliphilus transvaalensis]
MTALENVINRGDSKGELRNLILFLLGKSISVFGNAIFNFAMGLFVLQKTGSGLSFAITLVLGTIPMVIVNPFAGVLADRFDKKKLVVGMDLLNGTLLMSFYLLTMLWGLKISMIYINTFLMSIFTAIFAISIETAKPNIVTKNKLMNLNAVSKIVDSITGILGPMVGGIVFAFIDMRLFILFNAISYLFSGVTELFIDFNFNIDSKPVENKSYGIVKDIKEGLRYILNSSTLIPIFSVFFLLNFFIGFSITVPLPYIINSVLMLESSYYGMIQAMFPIGMIVGALVVKRFSKEIPYIILLRRMSRILALCMMLLGIPVSISMKFGGHVYLGYYSILSLIMGVSISFIDIPLFYQLQTMIPSQYRGRVLSLGMSVAKAILPIALILSGAVINKLPPWVLPVGGGSLFLILNLLMVGNKAQYEATK